MYLAAQPRYDKNGNERRYYLIRESVWNPETERPRSVHIAYLGREPRITVEKAREIATKATEKLGRDVPLDEVLKLEGLEIINEH
ncbi:MAG: hypothetical protein ABEL51_03635 [Salinibacter sp.]